MNIAQRIRVLGIPIDGVNMATALEAAEQVIRTGDRAHSVLAVNPEKVIAAQNNSAIRQALENAVLCIPDGIGVVIAARLFGARLIRRVPGSELMPKLCGLAAARGYPIYLFGGTEEVNAKAAKALQHRYPGLVVAGRANGYLPEQEYPQLVQQINDSGARLLFVALGSPRQELWIENHRNQLSSVRICQGVGGTFDVIAGTVKRAPAFFRRLNLEWAFRLMAQPSRIARQKALPLFAWRVAAQWLARPRSVGDEG